MYKVNMVQAWWWTMPGFVENMLIWLCYGAFRYRILQVDCFSGSRVDESLI